MNQFAGQKQRHRYREQTYGHQGGKAGVGGGGGMKWEIGIDIYTLIYIKWVTNKNMLYKKISKIKFKKKEKEKQVEKFDFRVTIDYKHSVKFLGFLFVVC